MKIIQKNELCDFFHIDEKDFVEGHVVDINLVQKEDISKEVIWVRESEVKPKGKKASTSQKTIIMPNSTQDKELLAS